MEIRLFRSLSCYSRNVSFFQGDEGPWVHYVNERERPSCSSCSRQPVHFVFLFGPTNKHIGNGINFFYGRRALDKNFQCRRLTDALQCLTSRRWRNAIVLRPTLEKSVNHLDSASQTPRQHIVIAERSVKRISALFLVDGSFIRKVWADEEKRQSIWLKWPFE